MKKLSVLILCVLICRSACGWGFFGHRKINYYAVFLLPPSMLSFYKANLSFITEHAVDPDKRRYAVAEEAPRHYIDLDKYGKPPWDSIPRRWEEAVKKFGADSLQKHGIVPWWVQTMMLRLTKAFRERDGPRILKLSAELGHYLADAHVPLHASSNHNGQLTGQQGIHGFWESRVPELLAMEEWSFLIGRAGYIDHPGTFIWKRVVESGSAADTVLLLERQLTARFPADRKYAYELRNGQLVRQYSTAFTRAYDRLLQGMVEQRMRQAIYAVASFWYTAWVDAGQPDLSGLGTPASTPEYQEEWSLLDRAWKTNAIKGRSEDE